MAHHINCLVEWVGAGSPPGEEQAQANGLEDAGKSSDSNSIERAFFREYLRDKLITNSVLLTLIKPPVPKKTNGMTYRWCGTGHENQASQVGSTLIA